MPSFRYKWHSNFTCQGKTFSWSWLAGNVMYILKSLRHFFKLMLIIWSAYFTKWFSLLFVLNSIINFTVLPFIKLFSFFFSFSYFRIFIIFSESSCLGYAEVIQWLYWCWGKAKVKFNFEFGEQKIYFEFGESHILRSLSYYI